MKLKHPPPPGANLKKKKIKIKTFFLAVSLSSPPAYISTKGKGSPL